MTVQSMDNLISNRQPDLNGWPEIKGNPLSKVGVFEYAGAQIDPGLDPNEIYRVYRPEEELSSAECIDSFKLLPWTDDHAMLGSRADGLMPAEEKGIHGVIGEEVYFEDGYLKGNIKIFSQMLSDLIESGKKELSIGYRCVYDLVAGVFEGQSYDVIQRDIRGNHVALVQEGRAGPDVAVLDAFKFTLDEKGLKMAGEKSVEVVKTDDDDQTPDTSLSSLQDRLQALEAKIDKLMGMEQQEETGQDEDQPDDTKKDKDEDAATQDSDSDSDKDNAMDAAIESKLAKFKKEVIKDFTVSLNAKNQLAEKLSHQIGTFDHSAMTLNDVVKYGIKELNIRCTNGQEQAVLTGYLAAKEVSTPVKTFDAKPAESMIKYFEGGQ